MTWQPKSSLTVETSHWLQATWFLCLSSLPPDSGTLISTWNAKITFIWKKDFGPLGNSPVLYLFSPGKMVLTMFLFQKWLGSSFPEDVWAGDSWCTDSSFSSLLVKLSRVFETALLDCILKLAVIPVACAHFLPNFFLPVNFAFNMLWYSTLWTATLSVMTLCVLPFVGGVNDRLLDHCQVSSVPHYCGFKEQDIPTIYTLWMVIYWNSNVNSLILWDTDFWLALAVSSNHQVFYITCNESKIYESFTLRNKLQECENYFFPYSTFLDVHVNVIILFSNCQIF